jgi:hypothetical protein
MKLDDLFEMEDEYSLIESQIEKQRRMKDKDSQAKGEEYLKSLVDKKESVDISMNGEVEVISSKPIDKEAESI